MGKYYTLTKQEKNTLTKENQKNLQTLNNYPQTFMSFIFTAQKNREDHQLI